MRNNSIFFNTSFAPNPFGFLMDGRVFGGEKYRFGFNGKACPLFWRENDNELKGEGNSLDFGARIYDSRLGRWLSLDPLMAKYPMYSPYNAFGCSPIVIVDDDGRDIKLYTYTPEFYNTSEQVAFTTKKTDGLTNTLSIQAVQDYMDTPEGYNYVSQFAKADDVISVGDKQYRFESDGAFKDQDLQINDYVNMEEGSSGAVASTTIAYSYVFYNGVESKEFLIRKDSPIKESEIYQSEGKKNPYMKISTKINVNINLFFASARTGGRAKNAITVAHETFLHNITKALTSFVNNKKKSTDQLNNWDLHYGGKKDHNNYLSKNSNFPKFMKFIVSLGKNLGKSNVENSKKTHDKDIRYYIAIRFYWNNPIWLCKRKC